MPMNKIEVEELLKVLEDIRAAKYPEIPSELIQSIVLAEFENQDNRTEGSIITRRLIDDFLRQSVHEG
jgi:hypothetical protein